MTTMVNEPKQRPLEPPPIPPIKRDLFTRYAAWATRATGGRWGFLTALAAVVLWAISGPYFRYSETWQLVINTGTTIVTFLMVFLIQNAQNRESKAIHLKLDELILCVRAARNELIDIEHLTEEQLDWLSERYSKVAQQHQHKLEECFQTAQGARAACAEGSEAVMHASTSN
ncbi:MAG: low affinity iron permease family protein [Isosphaeraceae bacterium]|nr:low affinity iron permease family protein [Isosphaeraceae bacterium]